jgi:hypothetical protein
MGEVSAVLTRRACQIKPELLAKLDEFDDVAVLQFEIVVGQHRPRLRLERGNAAIEERQPLTRSLTNSQVSESFVRSVKCPPSDLPSSLEGGTSDPLCESEITATVDTYEGGHGPRL